MYHYGTVLLNYKTNNEFINEAVFTMMHHIAGEVENTTVLFQPIIFKTFLNIVEEKNPLYDVRTHFNIMFNIWPASAIWLGIYISR